MPPKKRGKKKEEASAVRAWPELAAELAGVLTFPSQDILGFNLFFAKHFLGTGLAELSSLVSAAADEKRLWADLECLTSEAFIALAKHHGPQERLAQERPISPAPPLASVEECEAAVTRVVALLNVGLAREEPPFVQLAPLLLLFNDMMWRPDAVGAAWVEGAVALLESWWHKGGPARETLVASAILHLLDRLRTPATAKAGCMRRLVELGPALRLHMGTRHDDFIATAKAVLDCGVLLRSQEGRRLLAALLDVPALEANFRRALHVSLLGKFNKTECEGVGDALGRAWRVHAEKVVAAETEQRVEAEAALRAWEKLWIAPLLHSSILSAKAEKRKAALRIVVALVEGRAGRRLDAQLDAMQTSLFWPMIQNNIAVPNGLVRTGAAKALFAFLPFNDPSLNRAEQDSFLEAQCTMARECLMDEIVELRVEAIRGTLSVMGSLWASLPVAFLKRSLILISGTLAHDTPPDVRATVYQGLRVLLDNGDSHAALSKVLPQLLHNAVHDVADRVRLAVAQLLNDLANIDTMKWTSMVEVGRVVDQLGVETSPSVAKEFIRLLAPTYFPADAGLDSRVARLEALHRQSPFALRQAAHYLHRVRDPVQCGSEAHLLLLAAGAAVKAKAKAQRRRRRTESAQSSGVDDDEETGSDKENAAELKRSSVEGQSNAVLIAFLEAAVILWSSVAPKLREAEAGPCRERLVKVAGRFLPLWAETLTEPRAQEALVHLQLLLPPHQAAAASASVLERLRGLSESDCVASPRWHSSLVLASADGAALTLLHTWLQGSEKRGREASTAKPRLGLEALRSLLNDPQSRSAVVVGYPLQLSQLIAPLKALEALCRSSALGRGGEFRPALLDSIPLLLTVQALLQDAPEEEGLVEVEATVAWLRSGLDWTESQLLPALAASLASDADDEQLRLREPLLATAQAYVGLWRVALPLGLFHETLLPVLTSVAKTLLGIETDGLDGVYGPLSWGLCEVSAWLCSSPSPLRVADAVCDPLVAFLVRLNRRAKGNRVLELSETGDGLRSALTLLLLRGGTGESRGICAERLLQPLAACLIRALASDVAKSGSVPSPLEASWTGPSIVAFLHRHLLAKSVGLSGRLCEMVASMAEEQPQQSLAYHAAAAALLLLLRKAKVKEAQLRASAWAVATALRASCSEAEAESTLATETRELLRVLIPLPEPNQQTSQDSSLAQTLTEERTITADSAEE